jgi:general secretion pathway protein J
MTKNLNNTRPIIQAMTQLNKRYPYPRLFLRRQSRGFTLLEILIALFIFTIVTMLLSGALRTVMNAEIGTSKNADRLRQMQMAILMLSRDIEQTANRPITAASGGMQMALVGDARGFTSTHAGVADSIGVTNTRSALQRKHYYLNGTTLERGTWSVLDQVPTSKPVRRILVNNVVAVRFQYLGPDGIFYNNWPPPQETQQIKTAVPTQAPLPRAVRIFFKMMNWGEMSVLFIIPYQQNQVNKSDDKPITTF